MTEKYFQKVEKCPWCGDEHFFSLYFDRYSAEIRECSKCGLVYSSKVLNEIGLEMYWKDYETEVHNKDEKLKMQRRKMYELDYQYIKNFMEMKNACILDVGCADGQFLDFFDAEGALCEGVEYGEEAYKMASKKYKIYFGDFPTLNIKNKYNLIIFRGVIQYFIHPKKYLKKASELLKPGGMLYITSSPNAESLCFKLFKNRFTVPVGVTDYYGFKEKIITDYLKSEEMSLLCKYDFYLETPYADPVNDIKKVAKALQLSEQNEEIDFNSPPFWGNMLTLVYRKNK